MIVRVRARLAEVTELSYSQNQDEPIEHVEGQAFDVQSAVAAVVVAWRPFAFVVVEDWSVGVVEFFRGFVGNAVVAVVH